MRLQQSTWKVLSGMRVIFWGCSVNDENTCIVCGRELRILPDVDLDEAVNETAPMDSARIRYTDPVTLRSQLFWNNTNYK